MNLDRLNKINARSIHNAGPRYTPGIDSAAPNLEIRALEFALERLMCSEIFEKKTVEAGRNPKAYDDRDGASPSRIPNMFDRHRNY